LDRSALGRRQPTLVDVALAAQLRDRLADTVGGGICVIDLAKGALGEKDIVPNIERRQVITDHIHHHRNRARTHDWQPRTLGLLLQAIRELGGKRSPNRLEIVARIESIGNYADLLAEGLPVTQKC